MNVYRILKEPYWDDPLSVIGADIAGGRWNPPGRGILYTATSPELALLETLVHFPKVIYEQLPRLRVFTLEVPDGEVRWIYADLLPDEWAEPTALPLTQTIFAEWLEQPADLGLGVPSAVVDISYNVLLHPQHSLYQTIQVVDEHDLTLDRRLWNIPNP
ncbi:RES domain protein [Fibrisoma limi BUZ 3]|uniref:RES domain protein n=1 Tax=Fibrisoma limi BUZ 3 TaxID=1185876 RepID=I2GK39_9BACT|nr:RES family NAD+ phosphorylase [Fibrisoma limi]CCH54264.1 RES domain protein [Fibrisoma limi BUZ 3]